MPSRLTTFLAELKRRRVWRVAVAYGATALATALAVEGLYDDVGLREGTPRVVIIILAVAFPVALVLAWLFDITPGGIEATSAAAPHSATPITVGDPKSVAVLPLQNIGGDPENEFFSDGLTEDIIAHLSHVEEFKVISRTSVMRFKETNASLREIAEALDVGTVLEGSVRRAEHRLRVVVQLIDAGSDEHLWAETYDRELEDVFAIQSEIALSVASALKAALDPRAVERIKKRPTQSLDAHEAYLLGRHHVWSSTEEGMSKAKPYFERALHLDPGYAPAHYGLAHWYFWAGGVAFSLLSAVEAIPQARTHALRAIHLDPDLGDAYAVLAVVDYQYHLDIEKGYQAAKLGVEKAPNSGFAWVSYAIVLLALGKREESTEAVMRFAELEPLQMLSLLNVGWVFGCAGRLDEALPYMRRSVELDSGFFASVFLAWLHQARGEDHEAWEVLLKLEPQWEVIRASKGAAFLAYALAREGRVEDFVASIEALERRVQNGTAAWSEVALAHMGVPDHESALDCLEKEPDERPSGSNVTCTLAYEPLFAPIRGHPRFRKVTKRLGLAWADGIPCV